MSVPEVLIAGRYRLVSMIATGGMGVVWEAWDERLERSVAIKQLRTLAGVPEAEAEEAKHRAMREARITAKLHHPHAVPVFDAVEHDGQPCLVMQLVPSTPLSTVLRERGPLPLPEVARLGSEVASALAAAHKLGIVHRDVKPGNILITADGGAHISDFGISHAMGDATLTRTGMIHGTPAYLAPEVARGEDASFPADVFSLGSTLYAALEGEPPFGSEGNSIALLHKVAAAEVHPPAHAGALTRFLLAMLSSDPDSRPTMETVSRSLASFRDDGTIPLAATLALPRTQVASGAGLAAGTAGGGEPGSQEPRDTSLPEDRRTDDEVLPVPVGAGAPAPSPEERRRGRRPGWLLLLAAAVVLAVVVGLVSTLTDDERGNRTQAGTDTGRSTPTAAVSSPTPTPTTSATPSPTAPRPSPSSATPTPTAEPEPSAPTRSPQASTSPNRAARLAAAITDYYALLPDRTADAWPRMTSDYQSERAGGRGSYEAFWDDIEDVSVSDVRASPPDRVVATLTYSSESGRVDVERTSYRLVDEGGILKIAASEVLSSRSG